MPNSNSAPDEVTPPRNAAPENVPQAAGLAEPLVAPSGGPVTFDTVLKSELSAIWERRQHLLKTGSNPGNNSPSTEKDKVATARQDALDLNLVGLSFSGGGIRSGTLGVGFLQGLAKLRLLRLFDYLSTVSGGGYAGAWFAAWVEREKSLEAVERQLAPSRQSQGGVARRIPGAEENRSQIERAVENWSSTELVGVSQILDQEPEPLNHLRAHSRYLTPKAGLFSADTWTLVASYLRNTTINLFIITVMTMVLLFAARGLIWCFAQPGSSTAGDASEYWVNAATNTGLVAGFIAVVVMTISRTRVTWAAASPNLYKRSSELPRGEFIWGIVIMLLIAAVLSCWCLGVSPSVAGGKPTDLPRFFPEELNPIENKTQTTDILPRYVRHTLYTIDHEHYSHDWQKRAIKYAFIFHLPVASFVLLGLFIQFAVALCLGQSCRLFWVNLRLGLSNASQFVTAGVFLALTLTAIRALADSEWLGSDGPTAVTTLGPPAVLLAFILGGIVEALLLGRWLRDYELESRGKLIGYLLMACVAWLAFFGVAFYMPLAGKQIDFRGGQFGAVIGWVATTIGGLLASQQTGSSGLLGRLLKPLLVVAPLVFIIGFVALSSMLVTSILGESRSYSAELGWWILTGFSISIVLLFLVNFLTGANNYSLHNLYGNRLTRCYLGASRPKGCAAETSQTRSFPGGVATGVAGPFRRENPVTGFDPLDDIPLATLGHRGPYPLFNTALQLVSGDQLAWQDRKAASFILSPAYYGCEGTGWAPTPNTDDGRTVFSLGGAMTTSGAAIDPNMADYQSAPLTVFLTVFNARLGIWTPNPNTITDGHSAIHTASWFGLPVGLYKELFGQTHERFSHVRLSDGGGFENLGVYELIRRRCRFVVACDFAEDLHDASENLANLVRRVGIDFGIRIEIDTSPLRLDANGRSGRHVTVGVIHYEDVDTNGVTGTFVFIRSSLTGDESPAIQQYAETHPAFPHESTADQFFDADQFEAYRALGEHLASVVFAQAAPEVNWTSIKQEDHTAYKRRIRRIFATLRREWFPQPASLDAHYLASGEMFDRLVTTLRSDSRLTGFNKNCYPELVDHPPKGGRPAPTPEPLTAELPEPVITKLLATNQIINTMEMTWMTLDLDMYWAHPMNRGWVNEFRRWTSSSDFQDFWPVLRGEYSPGFVRFCERQLNAPEVIAVPTELDKGELDNEDSDHSRWLENLDTDFKTEWSASAIEWGKLDIPFKGPEAAAKSDGSIVYFAFLASKLTAEPLSWPPIGTLILYPRNYNEYELFIWFRGPYRSLGLGRTFVEFRAFDVPLISSVEAKLRSQGVNKLVVRYPSNARTVAERSQETQWANFYYDYEFRRRPKPDGVADQPTREHQSFIILERDLRI